ncbi:HTH-type transcriptional activator AmpR [Marinibacterium anthonyi]|nr:HTH-type transcriptional activator AmpR [Marinibacterium anthonyi]
MDPDWKSMPSLSSLRAFEAAARHGSFSAAARDLNVTHAAIAQQVRGLESELGTRLVRREGRGIALTDAGLRLSGPMREAFAMMAQGVNQLREVEANRGIRATTTANIVDAVILPKLPDFWRDYPGIPVSFVPGPCAQPVDFNGFDLGIRVGAASDWPDYRCEPLLECTTVFCAAPGLVASGRAPQDLAWINCGAKFADSRTMGEAGLDVDRIDWRDIGDSMLELQAARLGIGAIVAAEVVVRRDLAAGTLVRLDLRHPDPVVYQVITPSGPLRPPVRDFIEWLRQSLDG